MADRRYQRKDAMGRKVQVSQRSTMMHGGSPHSRTQYTNRTGTSVNRNRMTSVRPISGNNMAVGVPSLYLSRLPRPQKNPTMGAQVDAMLRAALTDCPAIGTSDTFRDFAEKLSRCVDTPAIRELESYINSYTDTRGSFWRFMARLCCTVGGMASSATGGDGDPACCDHWDTE